MLILVLTATPITIFMKAQSMQLSQPQSFLSHDLERLKTINLTFKFHLSRQQNLS